MGDRTVMFSERREPPVDREEVGLREWVFRLRSDSDSRPFRGPSDSGPGGVRVVVKEVRWDCPAACDSSSCPGEALCDFV